MKTVVMFGAASLVGLIAAVAHAADEKATTKPSPNPPPTKTPPVIDPGKGDGSVIPIPIPGIPPTAPSNAQTPLVDMDGNLSSLATYAVEGMRSNPEFQWMHAVLSGDFAGKIAQKYTGDASRSRELVLYATEAYRWDGDHYVVSRALKNNGSALLDWDKTTPIRPGDRIMLPKTWNVFIDQLGTPSAGVPLPVATASI